MSGIIGLSSYMPMHVSGERENSIIEGKKYKRRMIISQFKKLLELVGIWYKIASILLKKHLMIVENMWLKGLSKGR